MKCGVFNGGELREVINLDNDNENTIRELIATYHPAKAILSSVIHHNIEMERILAESCAFHKLNEHSNMNFTTPVGKPETIGSDRLALLAATIDLFPQKNNLAIALGTCITYNFVNKHHEFLGGGISPGMEIRLKSLQEYTANLPLVAKDWNLPLIGYDTRTNILSGVILGMAKEIDGMIDAYAEKYGNFNVVLTGGDAPYFVYHLKNKIFADPYLIFKGLYAISERNNVL